MSRIVKVSTSKSDSIKSIDSEATTWGELKDDFDENGIAHTDLKAVVKETKVTLEADGAVLPEGNFTIFMFPSKIKSGLPFLS